MKTLNQKLVTKLGMLGALLLVSQNGQAESFLQEKSPRVAPSSQLKIKQSGVPQFELVEKNKSGKSEARVKVIPLLQIGSERSVGFQDQNFPTLEKFTSRLSPPQKKEISEIKIEKSILQPLGGSPTQKIVTLNPQFKTPSIPEYKPIAEAQLKNQEPALIEIAKMSESELKLIDALIFLELHKNYGLAFGLLAELIKESAQIRTEASFHLGLSSLGLGLYSEFKTQLQKVMKDKNSDWQKRASLALSKGAGPGDKDLVAYLDPKLDELKADPADADQYQLNRAQYYLEKNNLSRASEALQEISESSPLFVDSLVLKSILQYRSGALKDSVATQTEALKTLERSRPQSEIKSISALTLARLYFQLGQYKDAFQAYLKVDKSHAEWPQAMVEEAWSQILSEDYVGAAGNMFSLHTDFFKHRFAPESYVVRTVGYLNLCQYGDGMKVLYDFKKRYTPIHEMMTSYKAKGKKDSDYYEALRGVFKNPNEKVIDGLPRPLIIDLARHPSFLSEQKGINSLEDQVTKINNLTVELLQTEQSLAKRQSEIITKISEIKKLGNPQDTAPDVRKFETVLAGLKIQQAIAKRARTSIKDLREQSLARMDKEKDGLKARAGLALKNRFVDMDELLTKTLDQSELLSYEIYSGAGDHLRYQLAGGDTDQKTKIELKQGDGKTVKWEFKGEVWEDEIGHYRSSLKNVCGVSAEKLSQGQ